MAEVVRYLRRNLKAVNLVKRLKNFYSNFKHFGNNLGKLVITKQLGEF